MAAQNIETSSDFLNERSFGKESSVVPRAGFEPKTSGDASRNFPFFCLAPGPARALVTVVLSG
jgi:hypothetical protein